MTVQQRLKKCYDLLYSLYGECKCPLLHETPFQLLAAVMLSAQCRDERVNQVTRELFALAPTPEAMAALPLEKIKQIIHPCGLYASKAEHLQAAAQKIVRDFGGEVPSGMEQLVSLPGIGRKSANVLLGNAFGIPGFPVDTHVTRLLNRIGLVTTRDPVRIEREITPKIEPQYWTNFSHLLIWHGRRVCPAAKPRCGECVLNPICRRCGVGKKEQ